MEQLSDREVADLREPVQRLAADHFRREGVRDSGAPESLDREAWAQLAEVGVFGVLAAEDHGGVELGMLAAAGLLEECGLGLVPGPLAWSVLAAEVAPGVVAGESVVTGAVVEPGPLLIPDLEAADYVVLVHGEVVVLQADEIFGSSLRAVDPFTTLTRVADHGPGTVVGGAEEAQRWRAAGTCLTAAYLVGAGRLALDLALGHARDRVQFGRPIGGFQAIKHMLADVAADLEVAGHAVRETASAIDAVDPAAARAAHAAKVLAGDAALLGAKTCIQVHGGMGYTWEADPHLVWKRVQVHDQAFGSAGRHAESLADLVAEAD